VSDGADHMTTRSRLRTPLRITLAALAVVTMATALGIEAPQSGAQAQLVTVSSRTDPEFPKAGDDVKVIVRADGCPPGNAVVETYLVSSDDTTRSTARITRQEFPSTLFFQLDAEVQLHDALEGWYGVRVVCGQYRPPREPITNTYFRIAPDSAKSMNALAPQVKIGGSLPVTGTRCPPGSQVEVGFTQSPIRAAPFSPQATLNVNADGSWIGSIPFSGIVSPGRARVRARCTLTTPLGDVIWINYDDEVFVDVVPA
jgi:hypothetical protein